VTSTPELGAHPAELTDRNIEIKVRVPDLADIRERAGSIGAAFQWRRTQTDTYFSAPRGRLKLRRESCAAEATLISYDRPDNPESRVSHYRLLAIHDGEGIEAMLRSTIGVSVVVRKTRELYRTGATRIHLDEVERLGTFVELETVVGEQPAAVAWDEHWRVVEALNLGGRDRVSVSYSDLMLAQEDLYDV
jgi:adenylate cyclase, class 2